MFHIFTELNVIDTILMCALVPIAPAAYLEQAMVGLMLGDGTLVKKYEGGGTYFKFAQGIIHNRYLMHVFHLFKRAGCVLIELPSLGSSVIKGKTYQWHQFSTQSLVIWNRLHALWYVNGVKVVPANISELITPISLAYWLMDDGGWNGNRINFATNSFTRADVELLASVLTNKFGLKCSIQSRNRLYIWSRSCPAFCDLVRPYVHESMAYKVTLPSSK